MTDLSALTTIRDFFRYAVSRFNASGLAYGHGTVDAVDEAAFIILETLKLPIDQLDPWLDATLLPHERDALAAIITRRIESRLPAPYLLNRAYIQGMPFYIDERVIVPRSFIGEILGGQTDFIVGDMLDAPPARILDLCTGSGCLAIMAAHIFEEAQVDAADLSEGALAVAAINVKDHKCEGRIKLHQGDLFAPLGKTKYDLIITNPPYVREDVVDAFPAEHAKEPRMAHAGGKDGLDIVRRILSEAPAHLASGGGILCEIGTDREILEQEFPHLPFMWLDTQHSRGEVFWLYADDFEGG